MNFKEKIIQLETSISADIEKRDKLNLRIKNNEAKLNELKNLEIVSEIKSFSIHANTSVDALLTALQNKDLEKIEKILAGNKT